MLVKTLKLSSQTDKVLLQINSVVYNFSVTYFILRRRSNSWSNHFLLSCSAKFGERDVIGGVEILLRAQQC